MKLLPRAKKSQSNSKSKSKSKSKPKSKKNSKNSSNAKAKKNVQKDLLSNASQRLLGKVNKVMNSLKAIGKPEPVTITWCAHQRNSY